MRSVTNVTPFFILNKKNDIFYEIIHPIFFIFIISGDYGGRNGSAVTQFGDVSRAGGGREGGYWAQHPSGVSPTRLSQLETVKKVCNVCVQVVTNPQEEEEEEEERGAGTIKATPLTQLRKRKSSATVFQIPRIPLGAASRIFCHPPLIIDNSPWFNNRSLTATAFI